VGGDWRDRGPSHHYFSDLKTLGSFLSALLAILLSPLILLGTKFTINL
jgi:hypothetical protein